MEVQLCHDCGLTDWDFGKNASKWSGVGYMRWRMGESCGAKGEIVKVAESERKSKHISPHLNIWDIDTWTINIIIANWRSRCDYRFAHDLSRHFCSAKRKINWYKGLTYNTTYTVSHMHIQCIFLFWTWAPRRRLRTRAFGARYGQRRRWNRENSFAEFVQFVLIPSTSSLGIQEFGGPENANICLMKELRKNWIDSFEILTVLTYMILKYCKTSELQAQHEPQLTHRQK